MGVAISDEGASFAFPLVVLANGDTLVADIAGLCKEHGVGEIIVGESRNFAQEENSIMKEIVPFVERIKSTLGLPVHMHPEFMTSSEAEHLQGKNDMHDASAAALILKSYLDTHLHNTQNHDNN